MREKQQPIVGEKFGEYTVISDEIFRDKNRLAKFKVRCSCGLENLAYAHGLKHGNQKMCRSCAAKITYETNLRGISHEYLRRSVGDLGRVYYTSIKNSGLKRGYNFEVTQEYLWGLFLKQNGKCALSGIPITLSDKLKYADSKKASANPDYSSFTASLDRIDNSKGYVEGNVQWVHRHINVMKSDHDQDYFINMCRLVYERSIENAI